MSRNAKLFKYLQWHQSEIVNYHFNIQSTSHFATIPTFLTNSLPVKIFVFDIWTNNQNYYKTQNFPITCNDKLTTKTSMKVEINFEKRNLTDRVSQTDRLRRTYPFLMLAIICCPKRDRVPFPFTSGNVTNTATSRQHSPPSKQIAPPRTYTHYISRSFFSWRTVACDVRRPTETNTSPHVRPPLNFPWPAYLAKISSNRLDHSKTTPCIAALSTCVNFPQTRVHFMRD